MDIILGNKKEATTPQCMVGYPLYKTFPWHPKPQQRVVVASMTYDLLNEGYKFLTPTMIDATKIPRSLTRDNLRDT
jgi:hypothetical protein